MLEYYDIFSYLVLVTLILIWICIIEQYLNQIFYIFSLFYVLIWFKCCGTGCPKAWMRVIVV